MYHAGGVSPSLYSRRARWFEPFQVPCSVRSRGQEWCEGRNGDGVNTWLQGVKRGLDTFADFSS